MISLVFPFEPVAWGRVKRSRSGFAYVPDKTRRYKADVALWASKFAPNKPLSGPIKITARFFVPRPKRPKNIRPITRPDLDNYLKGILDALNEMIWVDDSQIVEVDAAKFYDDMSGVGPRVTLLVEELT